MKYLIFSLMFVSISAFGDPSKPTVIKAKNSKCFVKTSGGEYPSYTVFRGKKAIYAPESDGVVTAIISPSGKYVALSAGTISLLDIEKGKFDFGVVVVNCQTGKLKGYRKDQPTLITGRWKSDDGLDIWEGLNLFEEKLP